MKAKYISSMLTLLLLASIFTFGLVINRASADGTTISIPSVSKSPSNLGTTFTVPVQISSVNDLFGFDINITWDNTLITFASLSNASTYTIWPNGFVELLAFAPPYTSVKSGAGYVEYATVATGAGNGFTGNGTLFTITFNIVKAGNFPYSTALHFKSVELSDSNANAITATANDGSYSMSATVPGIDYALFDPNTAKPYEYGKYFEVQVYASGITSTLTGYDLKVDYTSEYLSFHGVYAWGALGTGTVDTSTLGVVHVSISSGTPTTGDSVLLFTLTFQIRFDDSSGHTWIKGSTNTRPTTVLLDTTYGSLSFSEGTLYVNGSGPTPITPPSAINVTINLIQGDVNCDGKVDILDLRAIAYWYGQSVPPAPIQYNLKPDETTIDLYDLVLVGANFGYSIPDSPPS